MGIFKKTVETIDVITSIFEKEGYIEAICVAHAIDLISRLISSTELQLYRYNKEKKRIVETKDEVYYRLNVKPNPNENATNFIKKLVTKLLEEQTALVIFEKKRNLKVYYMYLADSYDCNESILEGKIFNNVTLKDEEGNTKQLPREYKLDKGDCLYFTYENEKIKEAINKFKKNENKLLDITDRAYKRANINKWRLKNPGGQPTMIDAGTGKEISYEQYKKKITDGLLEEEESIVLLSDIFDLVLLNKDKTKDISDHEKVVKEIGDKVAMLFDIPLDVFYGSKTEKSNGNNDFITFSCNPVMKSIENTFNGELIEEKDFLLGEEIRYNRFCMQHLDITSLGASLDKMTGIGFSYNQLCRMLNLPEVDEAWANEHHVTKNYADVKGGVKENG